MRDKKKTVVLFTFIASLTINVIVGGLTSGYIRTFSCRNCAPSRRVYLQDDPGMYCFVMGVYTLVVLLIFYCLLQIASNHPLLGGGVTKEMPEETQAKIFNFSKMKSAKSYVDEAEAFYEFGDCKAAFLSVQKGLSIYPENKQLISLRDKLSNHKKDKKI